MEERISMHPHKPHATSQPSHFSHTHNVPSGKQGRAGAMLQDRGSMLIAARSINLAATHAALVKLQEIMNADNFHAACKASVPRSSCRCSPDRQEGIAEAACA